MADQPHIFLLMTDQQKASATQHHGNPHVRTPTWTRFADEGVAYEQCYAQSPICTPSRASIMTGTYPLVHRVLCHQNHAPQNLVQLPELLRDAGYHNLVFGHYESGRSLTRGWDVEVDMREAGRCDEALMAFYGCGSKKVGWSSGEQPSDSKGHAAVLNERILETLNGVDFEAQPVFMHVAYIEPHPPYFPPASYMQRVLEREGDLPLPPRGSERDEPSWLAKVRENYRTMDASEDDLRRCVAAYYGLIEYVDEQMGQLLTYLEERGALDNAWVILGSDHGDFTGEKGCFTKTETPYECLLHVPLVIRGLGGQWRPGERVDNLVELLDLFPTILSLASAGTSPQTQGYDLTQGDPQRHVTFSAVGEYHGPLGTTMPSGIAKAGRHPGCVRGARSQTYSYIRDPDYGDEAYDLEADPNELRNLLKNGQPGPAGVQQLQREMDVWEKRCEELRGVLDVIEGDRNFAEAPAKSLMPGDR
ncbi:MAG: sulfatase [bacterium]